MLIKLGFDLELVLKCLKVFYKKQERLKFRKICFLLNEKPSKLLNSRIFRELITERVFVPEKGIGNPDQEYYVDWNRLKEIFWDKKSNPIREMENALRIEIGEII